MKLGSRIIYENSAVICEGFNRRGWVKFTYLGKLICVPRERVKRWKIKRAKWRVG